MKAWSIISTDSNQVGLNPPTSTTPSAVSKPASKIGTTSAHWFGRGALGGVMLIAAINAVSYFFRSAGIGDLIGPDQNVTEAMGFPFEIWRENQVYKNSLYIDYPSVGLNLLVGLGLGAIFGCVGLMLRHHFNRWVAEFEAKNSGLKRLSFQFSVQSLLLVTTVAAMLIAALTSWNGTPEVLLAIYFLGPIVLISIAMLPRRIHWYHRVVVLTVLSLVTMAIAISSGNTLGVPLDRVMLGIFVSWTPQSTFAAFLLVLGLIARALWSSSEEEFEVDKPVNAPTSLH